MAVNEGPRRNAIYKLIERSHDGGQIVSWRQTEGQEEIVHGKPIVSKENKCALGVAVTAPEETEDGVICALQCAGVCTVAATFSDVKRGVAPYAWLHQPVWYDDSSKQIIVRGSGNRQSRWESPIENAYLLGWTLGFDVASWGVALRFQFATAAPPLI